MGNALAVVFYTEPTLLPRSPRWCRQQRGVLRLVSSAPGFNELSSLLRQPHLVTAFDDIIVSCLAELVAELDQTACEESGKYKNTIRRVQMRPLATLVEEEQQVHALLAERVVQRMQHALPIFDCGGRNVALRMHVMTVAAQREQVEGSARSSVLHPDNVMKLEGEDVSARRICALVPCFAQDLIANR